MSCRYSIIRVITLVGELEIVVYKEKKKEKKCGVYAHNGKRQFVLSETLENLGKNSLSFSFQASITSYHLLG